MANLKFSTLAPYILMRTFRDVSISFEVPQPLLKTRMYKSSCSYSFSLQISWVCLQCTKISCIPGSSCSCFLCQKPSLHPSPLCRYFDRYCFFVCQHSRCSALAGLNPRADLPYKHCTLSVCMRPK